MDTNGKRSRNYPRTHTGRDSGRKHHVFVAESSKWSGPTRETWQNGQEKGLGSGGEEEKNRFGSKTGVFMAKTDLT